MNRTDRLYALVEELRAVAPRPRSARWLANRFEVSTRTVERDISALQQSGTPIYAEPGRTGGYCLDKARTLPPVNLTPGEAVAMAMALKRLAGTPFRTEASSALRKLVAAMQADDAAAAEALAGRVHFLEDPRDLPPIPRVLADALVTRRVLRIGYGDRGGAETRREIEPLGFVGKPEHWYLVAWCRLREEIRAFRTDRIKSIAVTAEVPPHRPLRREDLDIPYGVVEQLSLAE
ncbi:transcriptional regulator [Amycolatopsis sp. NBRC 101858]|uniref:helix-turn-helix transcriptional regulator n=1 Tax=Amycolatopsis sp. NBRC 101858 TaxID=3032200 RepID=UPI0024A25FF9|nr:YafY family protein [Amycolatopsis sp. NBRC 101858]GLY34136.1 transcriptional regulator [Amycolatopsis sp. NBRC 101858]